MARDDRRHRRDRHLDALARARSGRRWPARGGRSRRVRLRRPPAARRPVARAARGSSSVGPPCGTTRTRSGGTSRASTTIRRAVSVNTQTSVARSQSARSVSAWRTVGADRTVCSVTTIGCRSSSASDSTCSPSCAAEDAVLVLDHDDVVAAALEHAGGGGVVAALVLVDPGDDLGRLVGVVVADDRHDVDGRDAVGAAAAPRAGRARTCRSRRLAADRWRRYRLPASPRACRRRSAPLLGDSGLRATGRRPR